MIECVKELKNIDEDLLPVFAKENYLKTLSSDYGWFISENFIIPFVEFKKYIFKYITFTYQSIPLRNNLELSDEKLFLNNLIDFFKKSNYDFVTQPPSYVLFDNHPDKGFSAKFGTYLIDLSQEEDSIFNNISKEHKRHIRKSINNGIVIERGAHLKDICYDIINEKQQSQGLYFMNKDEYDNLLSNLNNNIELFVTKNNDKYEIAILIIWDKFSSYTLYSGTTKEHDLGSNNLLIWETIKYFKSINVKYYNFVGARLNPDKQSKQYRIQDFKKRFGGELKTGYLWKYNINTFKKYLFDNLIYLKTGKKTKDIIDDENNRNKFKQP